MKCRRFVLCAVAAIAGPAAWAQAPKNAVLVDHSSAALMDAATARGVLAERIPARAWKLYPASKWGYVSQVEGGFTAAGTCVVTARVMMMQLTPTLRAMLFRPNKTATAFDAQSGVTQDQCRQLARAKLVEAVDGVVSSLVRL